MLMIRPQPRGSHMRSRLARGTKIAHHLDVHVVPEQVVGDLGQLWRRCLAARLGRGVDQDVEAAERCDRSRHQRPDRAVVLGVDGQSDDPASGLRSQFTRGTIHIGGVAGGDDKIHALQGQLPGDGAADSLAAAGDQGAFAVQLQIHGVFSSDYVGGFTASFIRQSFLRQTARSLRTGPTIASSCGSVSEP